MYDTSHRLENAVTPKDIKIQARQVQVFYGDKQALKDVDVDILDKTVTAFIGPSGCGATFSSWAYGYSLISPTSPCQLDLGPCRYPLSPC